MTELNEQYEKEKEKEGLSTAELQQFQQVPCCGYECFVVDLLS